MIQSALVPVAESECLLVEQEDKIAMERHALATNKLCAIDHLVKLMGNRKVQDTLMEKHQLLRLIKTWIQPISKSTHARPLVCHYIDQSRSGR